jgi:hypothetical protein
VPKLQNHEAIQGLPKQLEHLDDTQRQDILSLVAEYPTIFSDTPGRTTILEHDMDVGTAKPIKQGPYRVNPLKLESMRAEIKYMLDNDIIEPSSSPWSSPSILVPKEGGGVRFCTDFRKVNSCLLSDCYPTPRIDDCIDDVGSAIYVSKFDLNKGYWQIPLTARAREVSAFVTPDGLFQYKVMPFGTKNASATFQRLMNQITNGLEGSKVYIDDVVIFADDWETHIARMREFFRRLSEAQLTLNLKKCEIAQATITYLGHVVGQGTVSPRDVKVQAILRYKVPENRKDVQRFLGMVSFYRKFCPNLSVIVYPITELLKKEVPFIWTDACQQAFDQIKQLLSRGPILITPDFSKQFHLAVDASGVGSGASLMQKGRDDHLHPIAYFSKKFTSAQQNYSTVEKELLGLVLALQHYEVYLCVTTEPIMVYTDHNPLVFLEKMRHKNQRLLRWALFVQSFNLKVQHIKGVDNIVPDALSRAC